MNKLPRDKARQPYVHQVRIDVLTQDRLSWLMACTQNLYPEAKLSKALLIRRAIAMYVGYLENIITPAPGGRKNMPAITTEAAQLLTFKNDQNMEWPSGQFPEDHELLDDKGDIIPFRLLVKKAHDEVHKGKLKKLLEGDKHA